MIDQPNSSTSARSVSAEGTSPADRARRRFPDLLLSIGLVVLYLGLEWLSLLHEQDGLPVTPWNPGLGMMFALIIVRGTSFGLVLFASVVLAEVLVLGSGIGVPAMVVVAMIVAASYTGVAVIARGLLRLVTPHFHTRDMLVVIAGGLGGAVISSTLLSLFMVAISQLKLADLSRTGGLLILGDLIGIAVVTPLVLRGYRHRDRFSQMPAKALLEFAGYAVVIVLALAIIMQPGHRLGQELFYILFVPVVIAAVRHGIDGACAALTIAQLGVVGFLHFHGFDLARFTEYQLIMLVMTVTVLLVGSVVSERDAADAGAREVARRLHEMQNEAARTARLNLVSGMAAALAHEINQPMTAARALARSVGQIIADENGDKARAARNVAAMIEQIDHAAAVVRGMREFLQRGEPDVTAVNVRLLVTDALALVQPFASAARIELVSRITGDGFPHALADRVQIQQVIINLVRNGIDAIGETGRQDGRIGVEARADASGDEVEFAVTDNGCGIAQDRLDTIFDPLSTTKADGLGLGLSISKTIVQAHGGRIRVSRTSPEGTEIRFTLPAAKGTGVRT